jgi:hypothetical protein
MEIGGGKQIGMGLGAPHAPWAMPTTPAYDTEMIAIYKYFTWLHHELVPYSYSEAVRAHATGHPIATPLPFDYPDDAAAANLIDEYLYGPWLLVAPLWQDGARARDVYLPAGAWTDYWNDGVMLAGGTTLTGVGAPLDHIPLYVKLGAIIPLTVESDATGHGTAASAGRLTVDIFPHFDSSYTLREEADTVSITSSKPTDYRTRAPITVTTGAATRSWTLRVKSFYRPALVTLNAAQLPERPDQATFDAAASGWRYDADTGRTLVKYDTVAAGSSVVLEPPCAVTSGGQTAWTKSRLHATNVGDGIPGNDVLGLRGRFTVAGGSSSFDPVAHGARLDVNDALGVTKVSVTLPAGPLWRTNGAGTRFVFHDPSPGVPLRRMVVTSMGGGAVQVVAAGRRSTYGLAATDLPLGMTVTLGDVAAGAAGQCGETTFGAGSCRANAAGTRIICRSS